MPEPDHLRSCSAALGWKRQHHGWQTHCCRHATVQGTILDDVRLKKIHVGVYRKRKNFRRHKGHRQSMTVVRIDAVNVA